MKEEELNKHFAALWNDLNHYLVKFYQDRQAIEDIASCAIFKAWQYSSKLKDIESFRRYSFVVARHELLQHRKCKRTTIHYVHTNDFSHIGSSDCPGIDWTTIHQRFWLSKGIAGLAPRCQLMMKMLIYDGFDACDVSKKLGISKHTVHRQRQLGVERLRTRIMAILS